MKLRTTLLLGYLITTALASGEIPKKVTIQRADLEPEVAETLRKQGIPEKGLDDLIRDLDQKTAQRQRAGSIDQLVYYLLQSSGFTKQPKVEPVASAREYVDKLNPEDRASFLRDRPPYLPSVENAPKVVSQRIQDFIVALGRPTSDERFGYFKSVLREERRVPASLPKALYADYARSMKFLYRKEVVANGLKPADKGPFLASLYQDRAPGTETRMEASYTVFAALSVLKALNPGVQLNRVLIVGPGIDLSPRTGLIDAIPPESDQPYAVADALLALGLSNPDLLQVHCVDVNDRVIRFVSEFPTRNIRRLTFVSSFQKNARNSPTKDFKLYFDRLGKHVGAEVPVDAALKSEYMKKSLLVRQDVAEKITAEKMNVVTERYKPSPQYDLVVVTNVFLYFNKTELLLALSNIHSVLKQGGFLVHNESRSGLDSTSIMLGLEPVQSRSLRLSSGDESPLRDSFVISKRTL